MLDWNDLRFFISVAREGSTLAAARELRVSQTTVARRTAMLEAAIGIALFERRQAGYSLTSAGCDLLGKAEQVEIAMNAFAEGASAQARDSSGSVKVTTEEIYATTLLFPILRELHERHPQIVIELDASQTVRDLGAGEADISLRSISGKQQPSGLVGRALGIDSWSPYCSRDYAARHGIPTGIQDLANHRFIGGGGGNLWVQYRAWLEEFGLERQIAMHHTTSGGLLSSVRAGLGIAVLPCLAADADPDLIRCLPPRRRHERTLWLLTHERCRRTPRVRAVIDFLYKELSRHVRRVNAGNAAA